MSGVENYTLGKYCLLMFKYLPYISAILIMIHILFGFLGYTLCIPELMIITLASIMIGCWAHYLRFCFLHKLFITYSMSALWIIYLHRFIGLGSLLEFIRIGYIYFGMILFSILAIKTRSKYGQEIINSIIEKNSR